MKINICKCLDCTLRFLGVIIVAGMGQYFLNPSTIQERKDIFVVRITFTILGVMLLLIKFFLFPLDKEDKVVVPKDEEAEKESYLRRLFTLRESKDYSKSLTKTLLNLYAERKNPKKSLTTDPKDLDSAIETIKELLEQNNKYIATQEDKCNKEYDRLRGLNMIVDEAFVWLSHNESQLSKNLDRASFNRMMGNNPLDGIK